MAKQRLNYQQSVLDTLVVTFNNGTGTRSTYNSNPSYVAIPGATGDTSYTAPVDVDIIFTHNVMISPGTAIVNTKLAINGSPVGRMTYYDATAKWAVQSVTDRVQVNAGQTITIGIYWYASANGQAVVTNNNTDSSFAVAVVGIIVPRGA